LGSVAVLVMSGGHQLACQANNRADPSRAQEVLVYAIVEFQLVVLQTECQRNVQLRLTTMCPLCYQ
jgi:hypothetical protein